MKAKDCSYPNNEAQIIDADFYGNEIKYLDQVNRLHPSLIEYSQFSVNTPHPSTWSKSLQEWELENSKNKSNSKQP